MLRLASVPFSLFLLVFAIGLAVTGLGFVAEGTDDGDGAGSGSASFLDIEMSGDGREGGNQDDGAVVAGVSMIGFGILGAIAAIALLIAGLGTRRADRAESAAGQPGLQQQQQVVVVTDADARVETRSGR